MKKIVKRGLIGMGALVGLAVLGFATFALLRVLPLSDPPSPAPETGPLLIDGVGVVDLENGGILEGYSVTIRGGRIDGLGPAGTLAVPAGATRIDGTGKFLIPGLWDMHGHHGTPLSPRLNLPLFVAAGVTGMRDMGGHADLEQKRRWSEQIRRGEMVGPRIPGLAGAFVASLPGPEQARALIDEMDAPDEFVKVYNQLLPDSYDALLEAANRKGIPVLGHRPRSVDAISAARAGHHSFEHARLFLFESYPGAADLRERYRARYAGEAESNGRLDDTDALRDMLDRHDPRMFDAVAAALVENDAWFCPTHITRKMDALADDETYRNDPRLRYVHALQRFKWKLDADGMVDNDPSPRGRETYREFYEKGLELTGRAHRAGVKILAGSDANDTYCFPGFGLHDELEELVRAGLTPLEALRAATVHPAEYFDLSTDHGTVATGKVADLVLLDADPLADIRNTTAIHAVILDGRLYDRARLDELLRGVERNASSWRVGARLLQTLTD